jgi:predicted nucleic acid-binding protein
MIAATAKITNSTVATRNTKEFTPFGIPVFNPFEFTEETAH